MDKGTLKKINARCKEGGHYSKWLYVDQLIVAVEELDKQLIKVQQHYQEVVKQRDMYKSLLERNIPNPKPTGNTTD